MSPTISILLCFLLPDIVKLASGQAPTWTTGNTVSITSSQCTEVTILQANSNTGETVEYSVESQTPNAGFATDENIASQKILICTTGSVTQTTYQVVVRAKYQTTPSSFTDLTITVTFTDVTPATGPTWNTGTSHTLDKGDNTACNSVVALSATSTDGSATVSYSIQGSSPFTISGSNILSCTISDITLSSYSVVVRANQDNNVHTDLTLTITVTDSSSGSGGDQSSSGGGGGNEGWKYGISFGSVGGAAAIIGVAVLIGKAPKRRHNKKDSVVSTPSTGAISLSTNVVKPVESSANPTSGNTTEKAENVLPNGDITV